MRYVVGALVGAIIAVLPGIPAFATWGSASSKPVLFDVYCDHDFWEVSCPSAKTALVAGAGALAGVGVAARRSKRREPASTSTTGTVPAPARQTPAATTDPSRPRRERDEARDAVVLEAALEVSAAVEKRCDSGGAHDQTIERRFASQDISQDVRDRAARLSIVNLPGTAVEHALDMGWLRGQGTGPHQILFRTSAPLPTLSGSGESSLSSTRASSSDSEPDGYHEDTKPDTQQTPPAERTEPATLQDLESLTRLHERGLLNDDEFETAKSRLVDGDS